MHVLVQVRAAGAPREVLEFEVPSTIHMFVMSFKLLMETTPEFEAVMLRRIFLAALERRIRHPSRYEVVELDA